MPRPLRGAASPRAAALGACWDGRAEALQDLPDDGRLLDPGKHAPRPTTPGAPEGIPLVPLPDPPCPGASDVHGRLLASLRQRCSR